MISDGVELRFVLRDGKKILQVRYYVLQAWTAWKDVPLIGGD
jgi:hypothetical protein